MIGVGKTILIAPFHEPQLPGATTGCGGGDGMVGAQDQVGYINGNYPMNQYWRQLRFTPQEDCAVVCAHVYQRDTVATPFNMGAVVAGADGRTIMAHTDVTQAFLGAGEYHITTVSFPPNRRAVLRKGRQYTLSAISEGLVTLAAVYNPPVAPEEFAGRFINLNIQPESIPTDENNWEPTLLESTTQGFVTTQYVALAVEVVLISEDDPRFEWWLSGGVDPAEVVGAYDFTAGTIEARKLDVSGNGNHLTTGPGASDPTLAVGGLSFAAGHAFRAPHVPTENTSVVVFAKQSTTQIGRVFGIEDAFSLQINNTAATMTWGDAFTTNTRSANIFQAEGVAGNRFYSFGREKELTGTWLPQTNTMSIGAWTSSNNGHTHSVSCVISRIAIYKSPLSAAQMIALSKAIESGMRFD